MKDSIRFKINIIFLIAFITLTIITLFVINGSQKRTLHIIELQKPFLKEIVENTDSLNELKNRLKKFNIKIVPQGEAKDESSYNYFIYDSVVLKQIKKLPKQFESIQYILITLLIFVLLIYLAIMHSFKPLKKIYEELHLYTKNQKHIDIRSDKKDEISLLANAFSDALDKNIALNKSRTLFMRNILHELNTPIAKGKLICAMIENEKLDSIFDSLSANIKELSDLESMVSYKYKIIKKNYPLIEIFENAKDLLFLNENIEFSFKKTKLKCDFYMMSLVFKNLIDNALKYSDNLKIYTLEDSIVFQNGGNELKNELEFYTTEFNQEHDYNSGLGLGLYISNQLLTQQGYKLNYKYSDKKHNFIIDLL